MGRALHARTRTVCIGSALVLALIAALPVALAFVPAETFTSDAGAGMGTGDLSAAALSSLDRDLQTSRALPPHTPAPRSTFVTLVLPSGAAPATRVEGCGRVLAPPSASWRTGSRDDRHPLLL